MDIFEFVETLMQIRRIAATIAKTPLKRFIVAARKTHEHAAKHGLNPQQVEMIIQLAEHLNKSNEILTRIANESEELRRYTKNAEKN